MKYYYYTYKITLLKGKFANCYYFGKHSTIDLNDGYKGSGKIIKAYFKKYKAIEGYTYTKEIICFYESIDALNKAEFDLIGDKWQNDKNCLNLKRGGEGGNGNKGKHLTIEHKKHLSENHWDSSGENNPMYGKNFLDYMTEEAKIERSKKISENNKENHTGSNNWAYGKHTKDIMSEETYKSRNEKISKSRRNTICINNGIVQKYVKEDVLQSFLDNGFVFGKLKKKAA